AALILHQQCTHIDITGILDAIIVPTLLLFRTGDVEILVEEGRYLAERITNSKLVEYEGKDHLFWTGDTYPILAEIEEFVTGIRPNRSEFKRSGSRSTKRRIDLEEVMLENFLYNLKVEEFAKLCGRSLSAFKRDFKTIFKTTPSRWIKARRLEYAKTLLLESDLNINQITYDSGFMNSSHFIKSFKEKYALPPRQYRSQRIKS
ncbi:MAG: helix-turn-helix domain-containing protein, partial [Flavobacteriaceae bacterium]|nr:helix-turn-helix domain-containing protein [Flavobacteriaceae bacterium]